MFLVALPFHELLLRVSVRMLLVSQGTEISTQRDLRRKHIGPITEKIQVQICFDSMNTSLSLSLSCPSHKLYNGSHFQNVFFPVETWCLLQFQPYLLLLLLLLLLLRRFSRVRLCATPETAAHQASPVPGILQARTLEWVAISFSNA